MSQLEAFLEKFAVCAALCHAQRLARSSGDDFNCWMATEEQNRYISEVLGASPGQFQFAQDSEVSESAEPSQDAELVVVSFTTDPAELDLLTKILHAAGLSRALVVSDIDSVPDCLHAVEFSGTAPFGPQEIGRWVLPRLKDMIGSSPEVTDKKKITWTFMQQLAKEF